VRGIERAPNASLREREREERIFQEETKEKK
jgi:hypothetical protein